MRQLTLNSHEPNGRRYNSNDFKTAIELYLRSRSAYRELRIKFVLPHPKRIKSLFEVMDTVGSVNECRETTDIVFKKLVGIQKYCKILVDEVHIKPSVRYQGNHLIGYSADTPDKPARTMLALTICPLMHGESFIARIIPVYSLTAGLLFDQIEKFIKIIHEIGGIVFLVMPDNLRANVSCFSKFHVFGSVNLFSVNHPVKNEIFEALYLLFDPIHHFKNIMNNWLTEKMKKLRFRIPGSENMIIASWGDVVNNPCLKRRWNC